MYPTVTSFRPPSGMRCDSRLLSSFITGALTATTVTLFLLRVVPGTYVVLPCDPTITARPVMMEEYLDRVEVPQQEVFPDDSLIDTRPLHIPAVIDVIVPHQRKKAPNSHKQNAKKKKSKDQKQLGDSEVNSIGSKGKHYGPKDLQQQLRDLQEKEKRDKGVHEASRQTAEQKKNPQQKRTLQHDQRQIKQHLKEIQMHLQQQAEEMKRKQLMERETNIREQKKRLQEVQKRYQQKQNTTRSRQVEDRQQAKKVDIQIKADQATTVEARKESTHSHSPGELNPIIAKESKGSIDVAHKKPPDSIILRTVMSLKEKKGTKSHHDLGLNGHRKDQLQPEKFKAVAATARIYHKTTDTSVPKSVQIMDKN